MKLKLFKVKNYRCFQKEIEIDFTKSHDYKNLAPDVLSQIDYKTKIVNHAMLYGYNGSGKTSICLAIMDITSVLTDYERYTDGFFFNLHNFKNNSRNNYSYFEYVFDLNGIELVYSYTKSDILDLAHEKLSYGNQIVFNYSFGDIKDQNEVNIPNLEHFAQVELDTKTSMVRYLRNVGNYQGQEIVELLDFVSRMLYFRSTNEGNKYVGFAKGRTLILNEIASMGAVEKFQKFMEKANLHYKLVTVRDTATNKPTVAVDIKGNLISLDAIASSGTKVLSLFFYWLQFFDKVSFLIIDEFDAYYHDELAKFIYKIVCSQSFQTLVTSHNSSLLSHEFTRPDCVYITNGKRIDNLSSLAAEFNIKEIRRINSIKNLCEKFTKLIN